MSNHIYCKNYQQHKRKKVIAYLGGKCVRCGFDDIRALQIDHVNGGGGQYCRSISWNKRYAEILTSVPGDKFQCLCANCNWIKRAECNEFLHSQC